MCRDETAAYSVYDGWPNGHVGGWKLRRLACSSRRGTLELGTEDTNEQSWQACTPPAVESSASADHHATAVKDHAEFLWSDVPQHSEPLQLVCDLLWCRWKICSAVTVKDRNRKPRFLLEPWRTETEVFWFQVKTVLPSDVCIYIVSNSMNRWMDGHTNMHGKYIPQSRRIDIWCRCNLWTVSRKTDGRMGIKLGAF